MVRKATMVKVKDARQGNRRNLEFGDRVHRAVIGGWAKCSQPHPDVTSFTSPCFSFFQPVWGRFCHVWKVLQPARTQPLPEGSNHLPADQGFWGLSKVT